MKLSEIASLLQGVVEGDGSIEIERLAKIEDAAAGELTFFSNPRYSKYLATTNASAILVAREIDAPELGRRKLPVALVRVDDPYSSFASLINIFHPPAAALPVGIHPAAVVSTSAIIGKDVAIGAHVIVGDRCVIGDAATIYHGVVLGDDVHVGASSLIHSNVTVREQCRIGERVIIHSGTVVGSDGFGFAPQPDGTYSKIPQRGIVVIENDVEIGANCTIDRATIGETRIMRGAKLDNLIQIAHNCVIGANTVIAAQAGISGSTRLGMNCLVAGQVGLTGHLTIADRTTFGAQSGAHKSVFESGKTFFGSPAYEMSERLRIEGAVKRLPEMLATVRALEKRVEELTRALAKLTEETDSSSQNS